jgi:hypothetical protein
MPGDADDYMRELRTVVDAAAAALLAVPDDVAARRPAPNAWSVKEVVGHLIDSAANNHQRFVRAQWQPDLIFTGYAQDEWVAAQQYQQAPWPELVVLWREYNRQLARVMAAVPADVRHRSHARHNLHEIAWMPVAASERTTLDYLMRDYVGHLRHHLRQIDRLLECPPST